jgi:hypothetical protein
MANEQDKNQCGKNSENPLYCQANLPHSAGSFYEIHVKGHLNHNWADWLEGLEMQYMDSGEMILSGVLADQSALMGILNKLNRLNLAILSVNEMHWLEPGHKVDK